MDHYEHCRIAVDPVILTLHEKTIKVLLRVREGEEWELPGGLLVKNETAEDTLRRKLQELMGNDDFFFEQFHTFTSPERDSRERTISIGYVTLVPSDFVSDFFSWHDLTKLPSLAFDHRAIIQKARLYLKEHTSIALVRHFLPKYFTINALQDVYSLLEEKSYDNRNFRKRMINSGVVTETKKVEENVSHRPGKLFTCP